VPTTDSDARELQEAADELGVHYQTAYRWVRSGRLPAQMVNGRYLVEPADIDRFRSERSAPRPPSRPSARRVERQAEALYEALVEGDEIAARTVATKLCDQGLSVVELIDRVLAPALRHIGNQWHAGTLSMAEEHRASAIVERILGEVSPNPRGRRRGTALAVASPGDEHTLPSTMAAVALRSANWRVHHLGGNLPTHEVVSFCGANPVDVVVISSTTSTTASDGEALADELRARGLPVVQGRPGRTIGDMLDDVLTATQTT
jgi:excisionase family DNA binding protein